MSAETPIESGLKKVGPGYSFSDEKKGVKPVRLSEEYKEHRERMAALGNPIKYLRVHIRQTRRARDKDEED